MSTLTYVLKLNKINKTIENCICIMFTILELEQELISEPSQKFTQNSLINTHLIPLIKYFS